jgi:hypothetical protein
MVASSCFRRIGFSDEDACEAQDLRIAMGAAEGVRSTGGEVAPDGDDDDDLVDGSSGKDEDTCCFWESLLAVLVLTRLADFAVVGGMVVLTRIPGASNLAL